MSIYISGFRSFLICCLLIYSCARLGVEGCWSRKSDGGGELRGCWGRRVSNAKNSCCSHWLYLYAEDQALKFIYIYIYIFSFNQFLIDRLVHVYVLDLLFIIVLILYSLGTYVLGYFRKFLVYYYGRPVYKWYIDHIYVVVWSSSINGSFSLYNFISLQNILTKAGKKQNRSR